ncbi:hypothetical protein M8J77_006260 [Diaphorina citri]|nr:hypothetical protein M8J77_006260 [Diaphorina citri]
MAARLRQLEEGMARFENMLDTLMAASNSTDPATAPGTTRDTLPLLKSLFELFKQQVLGELGELRKQLEYQGDQIDQLETYSRRNCLLVHGVPEAAADTEVRCMDVVSTVFRQKLGVTVTPRQLDRAHRLGPARGTEGARPRPIIVKFLSYQDRREVYLNKKKLKGQPEMISESLTKTRLSLLRRAREHFTIPRVWTSDGKIVIKSDTPAGHRTIVTNARELDAAIAQDSGPRNTITQRRNRPLSPAPDTPNVAAR